MERIAAASPVPACGFVTHAVWENGYRVALDWVNHRRCTYRVARRQEQKNGGFFVVEDDTLTRALADTFSDVDASMLIYMDEVGSLYCRSDDFVRSIRSFIGWYPMVVSMQTRGHAFLEEMVRYTNAVTLELTGDNRDDVPTEALRELFSRI